ncbi:outer membrane beta-barrel protein [uncultured Algibacter sp.]|uniref:outer membrane beta-barrel protein n=1 Tax=uncultured Algibacter sp. TaxID=298659 RepID=UPI003216871F
MKKLILTLAITITATLISKAQEGFSVQAGLSSVSISTKVEGQSASNSEIGFFAGVGYQLSLTDKIDLQPSLLFSLVDELNSLYIPIIAKYNINDQFNVQAGPQINYLLEDIDKGKLGIDLAFGAGYSISEELYVQARYGLEVSRDIEDTNINTFHVGVGYNF